MERTIYELKYCERCGALGLRRSQSLESYCEACADVLLNYSMPSRAAGKPLFGKPKPPLPAVLRFPAAAQQVAGMGRAQ